MIFECSIITGAFQCKSVLMAFYVNVHTQKIISLTCFPKIQLLNLGYHTTLPSQKCVEVPEEVYIADLRLLHHLLSDLGLPVRGVHLSPQDKASRCVSVLSSRCGSW